MSEIIEHILRSRLSKREFLRDSLVAGAAGTAFVISRGLFEPRSNEQETYTSQSIEDATFVELTRFSPITIFHGGNDLNRLEKGASLGVDLIESDIRQFENEFVVSHDPQNGVLPFGIDRKLGLVDQSGLSLKDLLTRTSGLNQNLLLDLKDIPTTSAGKLIDIIRQARIDVLYTSQNWPILDEISIILNNNLTFYSIDNIFRLRKFLHERQTAQRTGVSLEFGLVKKHLKELKSDGINVYVYNVAEPKEALTALSLGAAGIISGNVKLLDILKR